MKIGQKQDGSIMQGGWKSYVNGMKIGWTIGWKLDGTGTETVLKQYRNGTETLRKRYGNITETLWKRYGNGTEMEWKWDEQKDGQKDLIYAALSD
jgi:hypothetical protein